MCTYTYTHTYVDVNFEIYTDFTTKFSLPITVLWPFRPLGLASMKSESPNVRSLVKALVPLVKKCPSMTANDVRSAMYGLQGMHSSSKEGNRGLIYLILSFFYQVSWCHISSSSSSALLRFPSVQKIHFIYYIRWNQFSYCKNESFSAFLYLVTRIVIIKYPALCHRKSILR